MQRTITEIPYTVDEKLLASIAKALSHPVRLKILKLLAGEACCFTGELTEVIPMAQSTISQHLKALRDAGMIQGEIDPPKVKYCINRENWDRAQQLFGTFFSSGSDQSGCCC